MALNVNSIGEQLMLKYMLNHTTATNAVLRLYTNNLTPSDADTLSSFSESTAAGYAAKTLTGSAFTIGTTSDTTTAVYSAQTFTYSTSETIYGYYLTNAAGTTAWLAERFTGAPFSIPSGGGSCSVQLNIELA